jgi:hypothetical protein
VTYISGRNIKEYFLTFDAAKHIGMLSNTDRGSQVREYFLECERRLQSTRTGLPTLHDPKLQMLLEAIVRMDAIEQQLQVASREAADAKDLATGIMRTQAWMTIRQYVFVHDLTRQMPLHVQQEYARWLGGYCLEHGYPMYKALTADRAWHDERTYYVGAIHDTLAGWLKRQGSSLALVPTRKEPGDVQT